MWDLIVSVPDHCLSFYSVSSLGSGEVVAWASTAVPGLSVSHLGSVEFVAGAWTDLPDSQYHLWALGKLFLGF